MIVRSSIRGHELHQKREVLWVKRSSTRWKEPYERKGAQGLERSSVTRSGQGRSAKTEKELGALWEERSSVRKYERSYIRWKERIDRKGALWEERSSVRKYERSYIRWKERIDRKGALWEVRGSPKDRNSNRKWALREKDLENTKKLHEMIERSSCGALSEVNDAKGALWEKKGL